MWGGNAFWKTVEVALQKLLGGERGGHDCLRLPRLLTTNTRQLEILMTTLTDHCEKEKKWVRRRTEMQLEHTDEVPLRENQLNGLELIPACDISLGIPVSLGITVSLVYSRLSHCCS